MGRNVDSAWIIDGCTDSCCPGATENIGYRIQCILPVWTNRHDIRTPEQFSSQTKYIYSTVRNSKELPKGVIVGKPEGKVAVITGGSSGMALASAKRFVEEGAYVFITRRRQEQLDEAVKLIGRNMGEPEKTMAAWIEQLAGSTPVRAEAADEPSFPAGER
jgi:hypothetical protein